MSGAGANNTDCNNIIITINKKKKNLFPVATLSAKENQKLLKLLSKGFERLICWNKYKIKSDTKNEILLESIDYLF